MKPRSLRGFFMSGSWPAQRGRAAVAVAAREHRQH
jgi:hypothetical protein